METDGLEADLSTEKQGRCTEIFSVTCAASHTFFSIKAVEGVNADQIYYPYLNAAKILCASEASCSEVLR
jgi:hypothetical protein